MDPVWGLLFVWNICQRHIKASEGALNFTKHVYIHPNLIHPPTHFLQKDCGCVVLLSSSQGKLLFLRIKNSLQSTGPGQTEYHIKGMPSHTKKWWFYLDNFKWLKTFQKFICLEGWDPKQDGKFSFSFSEITWYPSPGMISSPTFYNTVFWSFLGFFHLP